MTYSYLLLGAPGSGKSTLAREALLAAGSGIIALAPGMDEAASYERYVKGNEAYKLRGFDDPEYYPSAGSLKATGHAELIAWLRGAYAVLKKAQDAGEPLPFNMLITDTFNGMCGLAQNRTASTLGMATPPAGRSPDGAAYWGSLKSNCEEVARACRVIKGMGVTWIATCHIAEKETKETSIVNPEAAGSKPTGMVPAIPGGFRDSLAAVFDVVLHTGVAKVEGKPKHYLQWMPDAKRPTKSKIGALGEHGKIPASWAILQERISAAERV